ncbi:mitogen-activated protein kinase [Trichoderma afarasin]
MGTARNPPPSVPSRPTFACVRCAGRKVKCDRHIPCTACVKHGAECVFQPPPPPRRRRRPGAAGPSIDGREYPQTRLQAQGHNSKESSNPPDTNSRSHLSSREIRGSQLSSSEPSGSVSKTQVIQGRGQSMLIDNSLWSRVVEEFHDPEDALRRSSDDSSDAETLNDDFSFVLSGPSTSRIKLFHPPPQQIHELWRTFVENVDPLSKVVHIPTLEKAFHEATNKIDTVSRSFEALMFAIYSAAVMSLSDAECKERLGEPRKSLRSRLMTATKAALSRANFMSTASLIVLQSLVIHIISARDMYEPRALWTLTGVAVRLANGMGLDRDGTLLGLPPFETELRRRIWWFLKAQDLQNAELCGLPKFRDVGLSSDSPRRPTNINDIELYPGMPVSPVESGSLTDMTFLAIRYDLLWFADARVAKFRHQGKSLSQWDQDFASGGDKAETDQGVKEIEEHLEKKYLRRCDPSQPLQLMSMLMARAAIDTLRFMTHHPRRWTSINQAPPFERQWVWEVSIRLLEQRDMLQSNPSLNKFAWHAAFTMQWPAFIHVLDSLRANPSTPDAEKAWRLVANTFDNNMSMFSDSRKPIHRAVRSLCLKAYDAHRLQRNGVYAPQTPAFILKLRQQQEEEVAKMKRQSRCRKAEDAFQWGPISSEATTASTGLKHGTTSGREDAAQHGDAGGQNQRFHHVNEHGSEAEYTYAIEDMDLDSLLAGDVSADNRAYQTINWEQWDLFLADSKIN